MREVFGEILEKTSVNDILDIANVGKYKCKRLGTFNS